MSDLVDDIKRDREAGTPGGWVGGNDPDGEICMDDDVGAWICCVNFDNVPDVMATADARRIARVPDMEARILSDAARITALEAEVAQMRQAITPGEFNILAALHAEWSQATFGSDSERDHTGPLNHLKKEIAEIEADPADHSEWADGLMLLLDAARRAGVTAADLLVAFHSKLEINRAREWGEPNPDGSVEHVRAALEGAGE